MNSLSPPTIMKQKQPRDLKRFRVKFKGVNKPTRMGTEMPAEWPMTQPVTLFQDKAHDIAKEKSELFLSKHYVVF